MLFFFSKLKKARTKKIPTCSAVIAAAGSSQRMNGEDKLFVKIHGIPVLAHTLKAFQSCEYIKEIIVVTRDYYKGHVSDICSQYGITKAEKIIIGGQTRLVSVTNGVFAVSGKAKLIAIHDGARPCVDNGIIERAVESAVKYHAAAPAVPVSSTIKRVKNSMIIETVDRGDLVEIQTPQVFTSELIKAALTNAGNKSIDVTDDCKAVELIGATVRITEGSRNNIKLTTREDLIIAEAIIRRQESRIIGQTTGIIHDVMMSEPEG